MIQCCRKHGKGVDVIMDIHMTSCTYIALIPAYKPLDLLPRLVATLAQHGLRVVVVNDGSGTEYDSIFQICSDHADICTHAHNMGKGMALKTGLRYILNTYGEKSVVVTVDADGQHAVKDALAVCSLAEQNPHTLVFGSRKFTGQVPFRSRIGNELTEIAYHVFSGIKMRDTQTGLRAFTGNLIPLLLDISGCRYEYEINMLFDFTKQRIDIIEHEIETIYENNNASSHFHPIRDTLRLHGQICKAAAFSYISIAIDYMLFALIWLLSDTVCAANIAAKSISALIRFVLNRKFGFKSKNGLGISVCKYLLISIGVIALNTAAVYGLVSAGSIHPLLAKLLVTLGGFVASWLVKKVIMSVRKIQNRKTKKE